MATGGGDFDEVSGDDEVLERGIVETEADAGARELLLGADGSGSLSKSLKGSILAPEGGAGEEIRAD